MTVWDAFYKGDRPIVVEMQPKIISSHLVCSWFVEFVLQSGRCDLEGKLSSLRTSFDHQV